MKKIILILLLISGFGFSYSEAACGRPNVSYFGTINKTSASATVYWNSISGASSYNVKWRVRVSSAIWSTPVAVTGTLYNITGLTASTNYEFQVQANCGSGGLSSYSSSGWFSTIAGTSTCSSVPDVNRFVTTNKTASTATIAWNSTGVSSYNVKWKLRTSGSTWSDAVTVSGLQYTITGLAASTNYEFQVQSVCAAGSLSAYSSSGWFTTTIASASCAAVPDVNQFGTINKTSSSATVNWKSTSGAVSYNVKWKVRVSSSVWSTPANVTSLQYNITGLNGSTNYEFQVQTVCASGASAFSASGWFTTTAGGSTACAVPASLNATAITSSTANLNWSTVSGATSYTIQYRQLNGGWNTITSSGNNVSVSGLTASMNYEYQVQTVCSGGLSGFSASSQFTSGGIASAGPVPQYDKVVVVVFENTSIGTVTNGYGSIGTFELLASEGALFTQSYGMDRPSQPNYFDLFAGSNQGWTSNNPAPNTPFTTPNIGAAILNAGKTFGSYCQGLPSVGSQVTTSGLYDRKHNYVASWQGNGGGNMIPSSYNMPLTSLPTNFANLPNFSIIVPDRCASMHDDCSGNKLGQADEFMNQYIMSMYQYLKANNGLLVVTFDEGAADQHIWTCIAGAHVAQGTYSQSVDHFSFLRMFYQTMGLTNYAGGSASRADITNCWTSTQRLAGLDEIKNKNIEVYPNPSEGRFLIQETGSELVQVFDIRGRMILNTQMTFPAEIDLSNQDHGVYIMRIGDRQKRLVKL